LSVIKQTYRLRKHEKRLKKENFSCVNRKLLKMSESKVLVNIVLISIAISVRSIISLHSYSGQNKPPMFGDYEAQRHWQEVTVNLPIENWYENGTDNDLLYWGLDYPPLTAYHSFLIGKVAKVIDPSFVELHKSRGMSSSSHKNFMRLTVLFADILIYIPSILLACSIIYEKVFKMNVRRSEGFKTLYKFIALMYPGQILIDNGHFQYNNISLGLAVLAICMMSMNKRILGAIFFVLALNYKQMEFYHALPIFCYLLANCFVDVDNHRK
jgi:alpha-1,3-glucosyltransferase